MGAYAAAQRRRGVYLAQLLEDKRTATTVRAQAMFEGIDLTFLRELAEEHRLANEGELEAA